MHMWNNDQIEGRMKKWMVENLWNINKPQHTNSEYHLQTNTRMYDKILYNSKISTRTANESVWANMGMHMAEQWAPLVFIIIYHSSFVITRNTRYLRWTTCRKFPQQCLWYFWQHSNTALNGQTICVWPRHGMPYTDTASWVSSRAPLIDDWACECHWIRYKHFHHLNIVIETSSCASTNIYCLLLCFPSSVLLIALRLGLQS